MARWRALAVVLTEAWPLWLTIAGILAAFGFGWVLSAKLQGTIQDAGILLEAFGLGTVAFGLRSTRQMFGRPSIGANAHAWFQRLRAVFAAPKTISLHASTAGSASMAGELRAVKSMGPGASLDQRIAVLEENLSRFRDEFDAKVVRIRAEIAAVNADLERETQARASEHRKLAEALEEIAVGGLNLEFVGLVWLFCGLVFASGSSRIAEVLSHLL